MVFGVCSFRCGVGGVGWGVRMFVGCYGDGVVV